MFVDDVENAFVAAVGTIENLAFAIENKLLKIKRHGLRDTEIFSILRHAYFHFFAGAEEVIVCVAAWEDDTCKVGDLYFLFAEIARRNALQPDERLEIQLNTIFPGQFKVRRLIAFRPRLGN